MADATVIISPTTVTTSRQRTVSQLAALSLTAAWLEASLGGDATWRPAEASIRCALLASFSTAAAADAAATDVAVSPAAASGIC